MGFGGRIAVPPRRAAFAPRFMFFAVVTLFGVLPLGLPDPNRFMIFTSCVVAAMNIQIVASA